MSYATFLDLPPELRNEIYRLWLEDLPAARIPPSFNGAPEAGLLGASRQVRREASTYYHDESNLRFVSPEHLYRFLVSRSPATRNTLTTIGFFYKSWDPWVFDACDLLSSCQGLRCLHILGSARICDQSPDMVLLQQMRGVRLVFDHRVDPRTGQLNTRMNLCQVLGIRGPFVEPPGWQARVSRLRARFSQRLRRNRRASLRPRRLR